MRILIALDRSEYAEIVLEHGLDQAARHPGTELHVVTAIPDDADREAIRAELEAKIEDALDLFTQPLRLYEAHVIRGRPAPAICALAHQLGADLLVVGRFHVPSLSETFVWLAPCPIMVVGAEGVELEAQCRDCEEVRRTTEAEQLFCARHVGDRMPELVGRLPTTHLHRNWIL